MKKKQQFVALLCVVVLSVVVTWEFLKSIDEPISDTYTIASIGAGTPSFYDNSSILIYTINDNSPEKIPEIQVVRLGEKESTIFRKASTGRN